VEGIFHAIGELVVDLLAEAWAAIHGDRSALTWPVILFYLLVIAFGVFLVVLILKASG
jgi:hypothetical protein